MQVLGVSGLYHDAAAALVRDGQVVAAAQEERFTRRKHDPSLPRNAIAYCLRAGEVGAGELDAVVYYEKPLLTFLRLLRTRFQAAPRGFGTFRRAMREWGRTKLWVGYELESLLADLGQPRPRRLWYAEHHASHAASAFFPSPFESAAVLTFDGVGEFATTSIGLGVGNRVTIQQEIDFPHSIGLLYSAFTAHCGFRVNSGEYKLMGLAPYGRPVHVDEILGDVVQVHDDGSFSLDQSWFDYLAGDRMVSRRFVDRFGPARAPEGPLTRREADLARSIQEVVERLVLGMAHHAAELTGQSRAVLAGGVALNCVSNARLLREGPFDEIWVQPAAGDAGGALGAAFHGYHQLLDQPRHADGRTDAMQGTFLGPSFDDDEVAAWLAGTGYAHRVLEPAERDAEIARRLADGRIVAVVQGRMEFGPRALGNRSILADPRSPAVQSTLNLRTKQRESFRPFAPAVLEERAAEWFDLDQPSPYMLLTAPVAAGQLVAPGAGGTADGDGDGDVSILEQIHQVRSTIPAVTHVDGSARVQTIGADDRHLRPILEAFDALTGCPVLVNTSFNVRGEPIVCTPDDAYRCFAHTEIDDLVIGSHLLVREDQDFDAADVPALVLELD
jgi:carbamoyltransferase